MSGRIGALDWTGVPTSVERKDTEGCACTAAETVTTKATLRPNEMPALSWADVPPGSAAGALGLAKAKSDSTSSDACPDGSGLDLVAVRGHHLGDFDALDTHIVELMQQERIPNGALGVMAPDGRLVLAHGYTLCTGFPPDGGIADEGDGSRGFELYVALPNSKFRIGSVSKLLTAATVLSLAEDGHFGPDGIEATVASLMPPGFFTIGRTGGRIAISRDAYRERTTVGDLLRHLDPWCERQDGYVTARGTTLVVNPGGDCNPDDNPTRWDEDIVEASWGLLDYPIDMRDIRLAMNGLPSAFAPGTVYNYSNYGYMLLTELIEEVTGQRYEAVVHARVLGPLNMVGTTIGKTKHAERQSREVEYYDDDGLPTNDDVVDGTPGYSRTVLEGDTSGLGRPRVYDPYGGKFNMANSKGAGGWTSTVVDMLRLIRDIAQRGPSGGSRILSPASVAMMMTPSADYISARGILGVGDKYYGMGLYANKPSTGGSGSVDLGGTMPSGGSSGLTCLAPDAWCYAFLFNKTARTADGPGLAYDLADLEADLIADIRLCTEPGAEDLFDRFPPPLGEGFHES